MFRFVQAGNVRSDETAPYNSSLDKDYTVQEFIDTVFSERSREWGYFGIMPKTNLRNASLFGEPNCEYIDGRYRKGTTPFSDEILCKKIKRVRADGGWSRMDYLIELLED